MARLTEAHRQQLRVRETQMELGSDNSVGETPLADDFEGKLEAAQQQLETLQMEQERLERQKIELAELNERKDEFLQGQVEMSEKLSSAITAIERGLFDMRQEMEDLEQTRSSFAEHLEKVDRLNPEAWTQENLKSELSRAISMIDLAEDEYEQAVQHLNGKEAGVFNQASKAPSFSTKSAFQTQFMSGLAFNLPLIILGLIALFVYL